MKARICFFGDSFTNGTGDDECLGWVGRLCAAGRNAGHDITVYNLGVRGDTSEMIMQRWRAEAEVRLPPQFDRRLVFSFGANDCAPGSDNGVRVSHGRSVHFARTIFEEARAWLPVLVVGPLPYNDAPNIGGRIAALSTAYRNHCADLDVPYLDVYPRASKWGLWAKEAARGGGTHPNSGGYATLAKLVGRWSAWSDWLEAS